MSIESIALENFSALPQKYINFKQDAATNNAHSKRLISLLKDRKIIDNIFEYNMVK